MSFWTIFWLLWLATAIYNGAIATVETYRSNRENRFGYISRASHLMLLCVVCFPVVSLVICLINLGMPIWAWFNQPVGGRKS